MRMRMPVLIPLVLLCVVLLVAGPFGIGDILLRNPIVLSRDVVAFVRTLFGEPVRTAPAASGLLVSGSRSGETAPSLGAARQDAAEQVQTVAGQETARRVRQPVARVQTASRVQSARVPAPAGLPVSSAAPLMLGFDAPGDLGFGGGEPVGASPPPDLQPPTLTLPDTLPPVLQLPTLEPPVLQVPGLGIPSIQLLGVQTPSIQLPGVQLPGVNGPASGSPAGNDVVGAVGSMLGIGR